MRLVSEEVEAGDRLDLFIAERLDLPRSFARRLIETGAVAIDTGKRPKPSLRVAAGMGVLVSLPPVEPALSPEPVPFQLVYEDPWLMVVNKPSGLVVHPAPGNWRGTLVHGLLHRFGRWGEFIDEDRPGIVHRLDATSSGLLVVAKDQMTLEELQRQFRNREVEKLYLALAEGRIADSSGKIDMPIQRSVRNRLRMSTGPEGKEAVTVFRVLWRRGGYSFVECRIPTGRTHQIRVHMSRLGHPLDGDSLYGASKKSARRLGRVFLHSWRLSFRHPFTGANSSFTCPLPEELTARLREILSKDRG
ncbi:MAG: RluA family pseudouridine synthase [Synergistota bacterium]|nr:RluA family pseudouridine synthase [Synergistota bacterium]